MSSSGSPEDRSVDQISTKPEFTRRCIALVIDIGVAYLLGISISIIPWIKDFLQMTPVMILYLLIRDYLFEGRGVGKNLMGLQVVNASNGANPTIVQSLRRNIVLLLPFIFLYALNEVCRLIPHLGIKEGIVEVARFAGTIYYLVVLPMEIYRAYSRADGLRFADQFAGTKIIDSAMDFSNILPKH